MLKNSINLFIIVYLLLTLSGCTTSKDELLAHDNKTMLQTWQSGTVSSSPNRQLLDARQALRRPLSLNQLTDTAEYTRYAQTELYNQFNRLPNPDIVIYIFPHLAGGSASIPVPGYSTVFPLYQRVQYAMPGERLENY